MKRKDKEILYFEERLKGRFTFMNKKEIEKNTEKKALEKFNSITQKTKVENQNQTHNSRQEGISKQNNFK